MSRCRIDTECPYEGGHHGYCPGPTGAARYKASRIAIGMTQRELALALDVDVMTVSRRERGLLTIGQEARLAIASLMDSPHTVGGSS